MKREEILRRLRLALALENTRGGMSVVNARDIMDHSKRESPGKRPAQVVLNVSDNVVKSLRSHRPELQQMDVFFIAINRELLDEESMAAVEKYTEDLRKALAAGEEEE